MKSKRKSLTRTKYDSGLIIVQSETFEYKDTSHVQYNVLVTVGHSKKQWVFKQTLKDLSQAESVINHMIEHNTVRGLIL